MHVALAAKRHEKGEKPVLSHYLNRCRIFMSWNIRNTNQLIFFIKIETFPLKISSPTVICQMSFSRPQCVNSSPLSAAYIHQWLGSALVQIMACAYWASNHYLNQCQIIVNETLRNTLQSNFNQNLRKCIWKYRLWNDGHFVQREMS